MGNEMGNNNTSGFKEEENTTVEALGKSLQDAAHEDHTKGENEIILQNEAADIQKQFANPVDSDTTGAEITPVDDSRSGGKEPTVVPIAVEASKNGKIENSVVHDERDGGSAIQSSNLVSQNSMKSNAEKDFPDVINPLGDDPFSAKARNDEGNIESVNTPLEDLEPKVLADGKSDQLIPATNNHDSSPQGEGATESANEGKEPSGETLSSEEDGNLLKSPTSSNMIDSYLSDGIINSRDKIIKSMVEESRQQESKPTSEENYGPDAMNPENMQESRTLVHIDENGSSLKTEISVSMNSDDSSSANLDQGKDDLIPLIDHSKMREDDHLAVGSNDGQGTTSDSLDVLGQESTGGMLIQNDSSSQLTETIPYEQPCSAKEVAAELGDKTILLEEGTESAVGKTLRNEGREFQNGEDEPVEELFNDSTSVLGDACEISKNDVPGDIRKINDKAVAGDIPCDYQSDKECEVEEAKGREKGFLVNASNYADAFEEQTQNANLHEEFLEIDKTKVAEEESVSVDSTEAEKKAREENIDVKTKAGLVSLSSAFPCSKNSMLEVEELTVTEVKEIKGCENGEGNKLPETISYNIGKTNNVSPRRQKSSSFDFGLARTEESDQTPLLYKASVESPMQERGFTGLERCDSEKPKTPFLGYVKEEKGGVREEKDISNNDKSDSSKGKEKRRHRSSLFGNCMCCATVIN